MNREELVVLHAALETVLAWPDSVRDQVAAWLAPTAQPGNGVDPHPPPIAATAPPSRQAKAKARQNSPFNVQTRLIEALKSNASLTERALACNAASGVSPLVSRRATASHAGGARAHDDREGSERTMEIEGRGDGAPAGAGRSAGPSAGAVELTAAPEAERLDPGPATERLARDQPNCPGSGTISPPAFPPWVRPLADFERRLTTIIEGQRFG